MKQLTKEQQEQAVEIIEKFILVKESPSKYDPAYFINSAKAFLQSLKPKVYVCAIDSTENSIYYFREKEQIQNDKFYQSFTIYLGEAKTFSHIEEARSIIDECEKSDFNFIYFILTE